MTMKDGKGAIVAKERGRKKVLKHYVQEFIKINDSEMTEFIIIRYTSDIKVAENLNKNYSKKLILLKRFILCRWEFLLELT